VQLGTEVHQQQAITVPALAIEVTQHERTIGQHGAIDPSRPLRGKHRVGAPQCEQIAVQRHRVRVRFPLAQVELAALV
jgi:hypothetical protein